MRAAFIDRDGVINRERNYVHRVEDFELLPGVIQGLKLLQDHKWKLVVVTNQSGIARGLYGEGEFTSLTRHMLDLFARDGITIDGVYHCPHHPTAGVGAYRQDCTCRKPKPGLLLRAASEIGLALPASVMIGDQASDLEAGRSAGVAACVLVASGHDLPERATRLADYCAPGLLEAAHWIVTSQTCVP